jgi:uncharacterized protein with FMN-binding domain
MYSQRARFVAARSLVALSGLAIVGTLAGCSAQSLSANVTGPRAVSTHSASPSATTPTATPTAAATSIPTAAATTTAKAPAPPATKPTAAPAPTASPAATTPPSSPTSTYADGNYSATGTYNSPGGKETIRVTLDLANDVVSDLAVTSVKIDSTAVNYENAFEGGINAVVVGKDIDSLNVGPVAGSSLTSVGFNRAIATIKGQAKN